MKTSTYFTITLILVFIASVAIAVLFVENAGIKDNHGNSIVPENDLYCGTEWTVQMKEPLDFKILERILREEIVEFGSAYDIPQRDITLFDLGDNRVRIVIEGLWVVAPDRPNLRASIEQIDFVDYVEEFEGGPVYAWCQ